MNPESFCSSEVLVGTEMSTALSETGTAAPLRLTDSMTLTWAPAAMPPSLVPSASVMSLEPETLSTFPPRPLVTSVFVA